MSLNIGQTSNFSPNQISGCHIWLDASTSNNFTFSSGSNISTWIDRSANGYTATAANSPTYDSVNKRIQFNAASSQYMSNTSAPLNLTERTFFFVLQEITNTIYAGIMPFIPNPTSGNDYQTTSGLSLEATSGFLFYANNGGYNNRITATNPLAKALYEETFSSSSGTNYLNGTTGTTSNANFTFGTSAGYVVAARWGGSAVSTPYFNGYFHEVVVFNKALSSTDRQIMEGYLAWKWGLNRSLPTNHPYYNTPVYSLNMPNVVFPLYSYPVSLFQPTFVPNCVLWLDAADPTTLFSDSAGTTRTNPFNTTVAYWRDKSVSANHASNTTAQPTALFRAQNGLNVVNFNGAQYLSLSTSTLPTGSTQSSFFFVVRTTSTGVQVFFTHGANPNTASQNTQFFYNNANLFVDTYGSPTNISDTTNNLNNYLVLSCTLTNVYSGWDNGNPFSSGTAALTLNIGTGWASLGVGRIPPGNVLAYYLTGQIGEVIIYNRPVSSTERQQIEGYLAWKWGTTAPLPSTHDYKTIQFETLPPFPIARLPSSSTNGVFNPTTISGLNLWLDASDRSTLTFSGVNVTQWRDKSGTGNHATNVGNITNFGVINKKAAMAYPNLGSTYFTGAVINNGTTMTAFSVFSMRTTSYVVARVLSLARPGFNDFNNTSFTAAIQRSTNNFLSFRNFANLGTVTGSFATPVMVCTLFTGSSNTFFSNGTAGTTVASSGSFGYTNYEVGGSFGEESLVPYDGLIAEVLHFTSALNVTQRQQIEGYLAWKWGLQGNLPSSHPFKLFPPPP